MFKFNFNIDENDDQKQADVEEEAIEVSGGDEILSTIEPAGKQTYEQLENMRSSTRTKKELMFKHFYLDEEKHTSVEYLANVEAAMSEEDENKLAKINRTHDVVAGEYEGGLKIWELSIDLARLIYNEPSATVGLGLAERKHELRVLEVGCGHSLPSLSLLKLIERTAAGSGSNFKIILYLQDFNKKVIF